MAIALTAERERALIAGACSRQKSERDAAFAEIVRALGPSLQSLCLGVTGNAADAQDALQDALYTIAAELPRFRCDARLYSWTYRIALRAAVRIRAHSRRPPPPLDPPTAQKEDFAERDHARRLLAALSALPLEQRTVMALFIDGQSHEQIAEILGIPTGTVWSRVHTARKRLREVTS